MRLAFLVGRKGLREWLSGRVSPCQGESREFESRFPLQNLKRPEIATVSGLTQKGNTKKTRIVAKKIKDDHCRGQRLHQNVIVVSLCVQCNLHCFLTWQSHIILYRSICLLCAFYPFLRESCHVNVNALKSQSMTSQYDFIKHHHKQRFHQN